MDQSRDNLEYLKFTSDGAVRVSSATGLQLPNWDYVSLAQTSLTDVYTYKTGGAAGTTVATVTITYTSSAKSTVSSVVKV